MKNLNKTIEMIEKLVNKRVKKGERDIAKRYAVLLNEIRKELAKIYEAYEVDGKLTYAEMAKYDRLKKFLERVNALLSSQYKDLKKTIFAILGESYLDGYYLTAWAVETDTLSRLNYSAVKPEVITTMIENPISGLTLSQTLAKNRTAIITTIQQEITLGLVRGETYKQMVTRLKGALENDVVKSMRIVRTESKRARETSRHDAAEHATKNGVIMQKTWNSVGDERVRHSKKANHRLLHGKTIPIDQDFQQGRGKGKGPSMMGAPEHDIDERCFLTYSVVKIEKVNAPELENMAFETWKKERLKSSK